MFPYFTVDDGTKFEVEPTHLPLGVCIDDLTKVCYV